MQTNLNTQARHTSETWVVHSSGVNLYIEGPCGERLTVSPWMANDVAEKVALALNSADELIAALSDAVDILDWIHNKRPDVAVFATVEAVKKGRAALAAAKVTK